MDFRSSSSAFAESPRAGSRAASRARSRQLNFQRLPTPDLSAVATSRPGSPSDQDPAKVVIPQPPPTIRKRKPRVDEILKGALNDNARHRYDVKTLRGRPSTFGTAMEIGPRHCRVENVETWFNALHYDPKERQKRKEIRSQEQQVIRESRRRLSNATTSKRLLMLSAALRSDMEIFVNHLLDYGTAGALSRRDLEAQPLTKDSYLQLKELFDILDLDHSGTLTFDELARASVILGRERYDSEKFRRLDKNKSGSIDFLEMLKVFFPSIPMRAITRFHKENCKLAENVHRARDRLAPEHVREIDDLYARLSEHPKGCCFESLMSLMSPWMKSHEEIVREVFDYFDDDGNGTLTEEEFCEMMKFSYPPYCREHSDSDDDEANDTKKKQATEEPETSSAENSPTKTQRVGGTGKLNTRGFSMRQIALNRWKNVMSFKLPEIASINHEQQHVAHPRIFHPATTRQLKVQNKMDTIVGKAVMAQYEADRSRKELTQRLNHSEREDERADLLEQLNSLPTIGALVDKNGKRTVPALRLQLDGVVPATLQRSNQIVTERAKRNGGSIGPSRPN